MRKTCLITGLGLAAMAGAQTLPPRSPATVARAGSQVPTVETRAAATSATAEPAPPPLPTLGGPDPLRLAPPAVAMPAPPPAPETPVSPDPELTKPLPALATFDATPPVAEHGAPAPATPALSGVHYDVVLTGAPDAVVDTFNGLSVLRKERGKTATGAQIGARAQSDAALLGTVLRSEGYYAAQVDATVAAEPGAVAGKIRATLAVTPGRRYVFAQVTLTGVPAGQSQIAKDYPLKVGAPVVAADVEGAEAGLKLTLPHDGYPFATFGERDVLLDDALHTADYSLKIDAGRLAHFGLVQLQGRKLPFSDHHAQLIARFRLGQRYDGSLTEDFRRALVATQLFGSVVVEPVAAAAPNADGSVDANVVVRTTPGPLRTLAGSLGYSTTDGVRAESSYTRRNFLVPEGSLTGRVVLGTLEQRLSAELKMANFGARDRTLNVVAEVANQLLPAYQARSLTLSGIVSRDSTQIWQKTWTYSGGLELIGADIRDRATLNGALDSSRKQYLIAAAPLQLGYDASNDLLNPTRGFRLLAHVSPEGSLEAGNVFGYLRTQLDGSVYLPFGGGFVLAGRTRLGIITGASTGDIAPTRRYYAGGGGSVRGYDFQEIGPKDANGVPQGGKSLAEFSIEPRYRFGNYGVVAFLDGGNVYQSEYPTFRGLRYGYGIGVRYYTSFGPLRLDLARALNGTSTDPLLAVYISIGQAF